MEVLVSNISPQTVGAALLSGVILSVAAALFAPDWSLEHIPERYPVGWLSAVSVAWLGFAFYSLQTVGALLAGDPLWSRIIGRYSLWLLMALAHGFTFRLAFRGLRDRRPWVYRGPHRREDPGS